MNNNVIFVILLALIAAFIILFFVFAMLLKYGEKQKNSELENRLSELQRKLHNEFYNNFQNSIKNLGDIITTNQKNTDEFQAKKLESINQNISDKQEGMRKSISNMLSQSENRFKTFEVTNEQKLNQIRETMEKRLNDIRENNNKKLESMQNMVDQKLQKTLEDKMTNSFKLVNDRLEQVYKGLGEMQNLASGVSDLKKVLSNVKTRGILGEIQLGAILKEILTPEQYEENIALKPGAKERVEFAIKLPGDGDTPIYLPIDSKFPADAFEDLQDAYNSDSKENIVQAFATLAKRIKSFAKDINKKYIEPPYTTEFAIMFLPFEGLYSEVVNRGLVEVLQREYHVNIAGPSTMAALLNSLQMGFKTIAIQKRSSEVWNILGAVKTEFDKFNSILTETRSKLEQANDRLDKLVGVRTRAIQRKLKDVEKIEPTKATELLGENE